MTNSEKLGVHTCLMSINCATPETVETLVGSLPQNSTRSAFTGSCWIHYVSKRGKRLRKLDTHPLMLGLLEHHLLVDSGQRLGHALQLFIAVPDVPLALWIVGGALGLASSSWQPGIPSDRTAEVMPALEQGMHDGTACARQQEQYRAHRFSPWRNGV